MWTVYQFFGLFCLLLFASCSRVPPADDGSVSCAVAARIDAEVQWRQGNCLDDCATVFIEQSLANELTANEAIQIALLNSPQIQAIYEELGIARANWVEAGLLSNPTFELEVRYPHVKGLKTNIEYLILTSILDTFLIPLRTKLAATEFEQAKLKVSNEILNLAFEVRQTFYELVAERKKITYTQSIAELASITNEVSSRQIEVGNINTLEYQLAESKFLTAKMELTQSQRELIRLREKLNRLLGFSKEVWLIIPEDFEEIDYQGFDLSILESIANEKRLDLQIARLELTRLCQMLGLKNWWTYTNLKVGLAGEREPGGSNLLGPGFSGEIPIFNYGQAARMRIYAQLRQAQDRLAELEIKMLSEVRVAHKLLMSNLTILNDYQNRLLPLQAKASASSEELYNVMGIGLDKLVKNKQLEIETTRNYVENIKQYLIARVSLDRALGGNLFQLLRECE